MVTTYVTNDRQTESGSAGHAAPRLVHTVETFEDAVDLRLRDPHSLVLDVDLDEVGAGAHGERHLSSRLAVGDGIDHDVAQRRFQLCRVPVDQLAPVSPADHLYLFQLRGMGDELDGCVDESVDLNHRRVLQGVVTLDAGKVDHVVDQLRQPSRLSLHAVGEMLDCLGVVSGGDDRLGQ